MSEFETLEFEDPRDDTEPIQPTPEREFRRHCRGCSPRRMTRTEITRYGLDKLEADRADA